MSAYKLTYFNITGIGEPIRFLLSYGGADYEDKRIEFEEWPQYKHKTPMEQVPILEIDGKVFHQTRAIGRYLARKFNLYSSDDLEAMEIDATIDDIDDCRIFVSTYFREKDPAIKAKQKEIAHEKITFYLGKFEEQVKKNGGYFVGNKLSWADITFTAIIEGCSNILEKDQIEEFPALKKLTETVRSFPKIKAYIEKRPKTII
ncbi:hypothetical protein QAD02_011151 [Eretmocerus hayati]|uniref:Uncharacterized protein n=1 Tax=Eretmocerus hayati TaxID=131215 RepID=A0ACC2NVZ3_9HYME|nr:hypothetical protein QAD02_011151 [Eretmocerus hayati]